jgi:Zn-dependent protease with chaperone function
MQRAAARRLGRNGEDHTETYMPTPAKLRRIVKLLLSWPVAIFASHPMTADRMAMLEAAGGGSAGEPLLSFGEWRALKAICK